MGPKKIRSIFERFAAANPTPTTELEYKTSYQLLVAVILSAQATDKGVNIATRKLFPKVSTPADMVQLGEAGLIEIVKTIGLYKSKAKNVMETSRLLLDKHHGEVPHDRAALEALPGVGRKTANVILNTVFGDPVIAVDTHAFRVGNRTGIAPGKNVREVEEQLMKRIPKTFLYHAHHWIILHGRYVCKARKPECPGCLIRDLCEYPDKTLA